VVTINLPKLGYLAADENDFYKRLDNLMELARNSLKIKRKTIEKLTDDNLYPYSKYYLCDIKKRFGEYWKNHFNTIGIIGMNEALLNFIGVDIMHEEGLEFAEKTMDFMNERLESFQDEDNMLYNLEATPAEGASYSLAKRDKEKYPNIITAGTDKPYYTNSTNLPVNCKMDLFKSLKHQDKLQVKYTGGTVFHVFIGESIEDSTTVKELVKKISSEYRLPYFTITPTFSICPIHGYLKGKHEHCPICKQERLEQLTKKLESLQAQLNTV
ncbi:MAG: anaerobic ribonucleoside-triphosphate reductase, partial [Deferribacterota bacterium]|nr:anaerobic ribonucleoside-triphosphate reductase [Deferribacterota bacterium]